MNEKYHFFHSSLNPACINTHIHTQGVNIIRKTTKWVDFLLHNILRRIVLERESKYNRETEWGTCLKVLLSVRPCKNETCSMYPKIPADRPRQPLLKSNQDAKREVRSFNSAFTKAMQVSTLHSRKEGSDEREIPTRYAIPIVHGCCPAGLVVPLQSLLFFGRLHKYPLE